MERLKSSLLKCSYNTRHSYILFDTLKNLERFSTNKARMDYALFFITNCNIFETEILQILSCGIQIHVLSNYGNRPIIFLESLSQRSDGGCVSVRPFPTLFEKEKEGEGKIQTLLVEFPRFSSFNFYLTHRTVTRP